MTDYCICCVHAVFLHRVDTNWSRHKICWEDRVKVQRGHVMTFDGTPFVSLSSVVLECQYGRDRKTAEKRKRRVHAEEVG